MYCCYWMCGDGEVTKGCFFEVRKKLATSSGLFAASRAIQSQRAEHGDSKGQGQCRTIVIVFYLGGRRWEVCNGRGL